MTFIGDSIVSGLDVHSHFKAKNLGIPGDTVARLSDAIQNYSNLEGEFIVLAIGVNDIGERTETIFTHYKTLIKNIPTSSTIFISSILPIDEDLYRQTWGMKKTNAQINKINKLLSSFSNASALHFYDTSKLLKNSEGSLRGDCHLGDGLHLSALGYKIWAKSLEEGLRLADNV